MVRRITGALKAHPPNWPVHIDRQEAMTSPALQQAKRIVTEGMSFRIATNAGTFPPRDVANLFFACGYDDLPAEEVLKWEPFELTEHEYQALLGWWQVTHPGARVDRLGMTGADFSRWFTAAARRAS
jgi:hypothetical protein